MRLNGQIKMGFFPTPPSIVEKIKTLIKFPNETVSIIDPCCGEGSALIQLTENQNAETYGVEPDNHRAKEARQKLSKILNCGCEETRISNKVFSCLYLNPPYDWETIDTGNDDYSDINKSERKEKVFLMNTTKYLQPDGLLIYIIPFQRLRADIIKYICSKCWWCFTSKCNRI